MDFSASLFRSLLLPTPAQREYLQDLVRSHSIPQETSYFRAVVDSSPSDLAQYDNDINILQQLLDRVKSERASLHEYSVGCHSVLSPIRRLPNEVLTEIFALCAPQLQPYYSSPRSYHTFRTGLERAAQVHLLRLSQVCCRWYHIATSTPSLWTTIEVDFTLIRQEHDQTIFESLIQISLQRSAKCPLNVACRMSWGLNSGGPCTTLLAQSSRRWRSVDFYIQESAFPLLSPARRNVPLLESLQLGGGVLADLDIFETAPRLTSVQLDSLRQTPSVLPWGQLQDLTYENLDGEELLDNGLAVVGRLPPSASFSVSNLDLCYLDTANSVLPPVCSNIRNFSLGLCDAVIERPGSLERSREFLAAVMRMLTLPSLKEMFLESSVSDWPVFWPQGQFLELASRSSFHSSLTDLLLYHVVITAEELVECLSNLPGLEILFIQDVPEMEDNPRNTLITDSLLRRLFWSSNPDCLVPKLNILDFASFFAFDQHVWLEFIRSRLVPGRNNVGPFSMDVYCLFEHQPEMDEEIITQIAELRDLGELSLSLTPFKEDSKPF